jgi:hypothetical protein
VVTLDELRAHRPQEVECRLVLDTLGDRLQPELLRDGDRALDDPAIVLGIQQVADERAVDFQAAQRQGTQVGEGGKARAEVIE